MKTDSSTLRTSRRVQIHWKRIHVLTNFSKLITRSGKRNQPWLVIQWARVSPLKECSRNQLCVSLATRNLCHNGLRLSVGASNTRAVCLRSLTKLVRLNVADRRLRTYWVTFRGSGSLVISTLDMIREWSEIIFGRWKTTDGGFFDDRFVTDTRLAGVSHASLHTHSPAAQNSSADD